MLKPNKNESCNAFILRSIPILVKEGNTKPEAIAASEEVWNRFRYKSSKLDLMDKFNNARLG